MTIADQVRQALRAACPSAWSHKERAALNDLADVISDRAAEKLRNLMR